MKASADGADIAAAAAANSNVTSAIRSMLVQCFHPGEHATTYVRRESEKKGIPVSVKCECGFG